MKIERDIENFFKENYKDYLQTISLVSKDDSNENPISMIENENIKIFNFDKGVLKKIWKKSGKAHEIMAVDGLDFQNDTIYLIEFKNGKLNKKEDKIGIRLKLIESLLGMIKGFEESNFECDFKNLLNLKKKYILVYNEEKNYLASSFGNILEGKVNIQILKELLSEYEKTLIDKILFMSKKEFEDFYLKKYYGE